MPLSQKQVQQYQDYYNYLDDEEDRKVFERRQKFMRDRERCYICSFVNYINETFQSFFKGFV